MLVSLTEKQVGVIKYALESEIERLKIEQLQKKTTDAMNRRVIGVYVHLKSRKY